MDGERKEEAAGDGPRAENDNHESFQLLEADRDDANANLVDSPKDFSLIVKGQFAASLVTCLLVDRLKCQHHASVSQARLC